MANRKCTKKAKKKSTIRTKEKKKVIDKKDIFSRRL